MISPGSRPSPIRDKIGHSSPATRITSPSPIRKRCRSIGFDPLEAHTVLGRVLRPTRGITDPLYCPVSKAHCAPPPSFCRISFGSTVQVSLVTPSMGDPAPPSETTPAAARVAKSSLASRPFRTRLAAPKASSHVRDVISTLLARQTTESVVTEIFRLGGKLMRLLPLNSRAMARRSKEPSTDEWKVTTPASARAAGPDALPDAADAVDAPCPRTSKTARNENFFIIILLAMSNVHWRSHAPARRVRRRSAASRRRSWTTTTPGSLRWATLPTVPPPSWPAQSQ